MNTQLRDEMRRSIQRGKRSRFSPLLNLEIIDTGKSFRLFNPQKQEFLQAVLTGEE